MTISPGPGAPSLTITRSNRTPRSHDPLTITDMQTSNARHDHQREAKHEHEHDVERDHRLVPPPSFTWRGRKPRKPACAGAVPRRPIDSGS